MENEATIAGDFDQNVLGFQPGHRSRDHQTIVCSVNLDRYMLPLHLFLHLLSLSFHLLRFCHDYPSLLRRRTRTRAFDLTPGMYVTHVAIVLAPDQAMDAEIIREKIEVRQEWEQHE